MFKKLVITLGAVAMLAGCQAQPPLAYEPFNDNVSRYLFEKEKGVAYGSKAFYIVYGQVGVDKAGTAIHFGGRKFYRIKDLLDKYPEMRGSAAAVKAEAAQEKLIKKMFPKGTK